MQTLAERRVHDLASARIGRMLIRYRFFIHASLLMLAVALASADRRPPPASANTTPVSLRPASAAAEQPPVDDRPLVLPDR